MHMHLWHFHNIVKFKIHQYQLKALSPNWIILPKVTRYIIRYLSQVCIPCVHVMCYYCHTQRTWLGTSPVQYLTLPFSKRMATYQLTWPLPWWMGKPLLPTPITAARALQQLSLDMHQFLLNKLCHWQLMRIHWTSCITIYNISNVLPVIHASCTYINYYNTDDMVYKECVCIPVIDNYNNYYYYRLWVCLWVYHLWIISLTCIVWYRSYFILDDKNNGSLTQHR